MAERGSALAIDRQNLNTPGDRTLSLGRHLYNVRLVGKN